MGKKTFFGLVLDRKKQGKDIDRPSFNSEMMRPLVGKILEFYEETNSGGQKNYISLELSEKSQKIKESRPRESRITHWYWNSAEVVKVEMTREQFNRYWGIKVDKLTPEVRDLSSQISSLFPRPLAAGDLGDLEKFDVLIEKIYNAGKKDSDSEADHVL